MDEENKNIPEEAAKPPLDEKKKTALLRYITVLFAAAFLVVLLSMLSQMHSSKDTISQLNQSSTNALQKAEQLQDSNRRLAEENEALQAEIDRLTEENDRLQQELTAAEGKEKQAYELLLTAMRVGSQEGNVAASRALENLKSYEQYLGEEGLKIYDSLLEEGE